MGLMLVLVLAAAARAEAPAVALNVGDSCVLIDGAGTELVPQGLYSNIEPLGDKPPYLYAAYAIAGEEPDKAKLLGADGKPLSDFSYEYLTDVGDKVLFGQEGFYGVMDASQNVIVPCAYTSIVSNGEGGYLALTSDPFDDRADGVYFIDPDGNETATGIRVVGGLSDFSGGLMAALSAESGRTGYLSPRGDWAIAAQFGYAGPFAGGFASAALDSGTGLIDASGNWLITPKYQMLALAGNGAAVVAQTDGTKISLFDTKTFKVVKEFEGEDIYFAASPDSPLVTLYLDGKTALVDLQGNEVLATAETDTTVESDDARVILREGPWGEKNATLCDLTGKRLAGPYQDIWRVSAASTTPYYAFSSFETQTENAGGDDYLNEVPNTRRTGIMDADGKVVCQPDDILELYSPVDGLFTVQTPDKAGIMKADGTWLKTYDVASEDEE